MNIKTNDMQKMANALTKATGSTTSIEIVVWSYNHTGKPGQISGTRISYQLWIDAWRDIKRVDTWPELVTLVQSLIDKETQHGRES